MIFSVIITIASTLLLAISAVMPSVTVFGSDVTNAFTSIGTYFAYFDFLINTTALISAVSLVIAFEIIVAGVNLFRWLFRSMPFLNSRV